MNENNKMPLLERHAATIKMFSIGILALLLLIPASMVKSLIQERESRKHQVIADIAGKWGRAQQVVGPLLVIPYHTHARDADGRPTKVKRAIYLLPEQLDITGDMTPSVRYRGIYETVVYDSTLEFNGHFSLAPLRELSVPSSDLLLSQATIIMGISDTKGIRQEIEFLLGDQAIAFSPGIGVAAAGYALTAGALPQSLMYRGANFGVNAGTGIASHGVSAKVKDLESLDGKSFKAKLSLGGSESLQLAPVGRTTKIALKSSWASPAFIGNALPVHREVSDQGFTASWQQLHFNRDYPQAWSSEQYSFAQSLLGVELLIAADAYQQTMRTAKYAVMLIAFTFLAFFLAEVTSRQRVHPIQYLLVGFALLVFYTLLLALAEHMSFVGAYLIASVAVTLLIAGYTKSALHSQRMAWLVGAILSLLYGYLMIVLQLQDYALLMGSIGLFAVLAAVMYMTRKFDWYRLTPGP